MTSIPQAEDGMAPSPGRSALAPMTKTLLAAILVLASVGVAPAARAADAANCDPYKNYECDAIHRVALWRRHTA